MPKTQRPRKLSLKPQLSELEKTELIYPTYDVDPSYMFKHALTQESAYESLLHRTRRVIHLRVAQAYEELYADRLDQVAALLSQHYSEAREDAKTLEYAIRAGNVALRLYANIEAIEHYSRALEIAKRTGSGADQLAHIYIQRGRAFETSSRFVDALRNYEEAESLAIQRGDNALQLAALLPLATIYSTPTIAFDATRGRTLSNLALSLARELGDRPSEARVLWTLMLLSNFSGNLREAVEYGEQSLAISREVRRREQIAYALNDLFRPYMSTGQYERARAVAEEARDFWRESGNQPMLADNLSRSARILFALGEFDRAVALSDEARQISQSIGNLWGQSFCRMFVGYVFIERGEMSRAIETMKECIRLGDESGFVMAQVATRADLGWLYGTLGVVDRGIQLVQEARSRAEQRLPSFRPWALACLARLNVMNGDIARAKTNIAEGYANLTEDLAQHTYIEMPLADAEVALAEKDYVRAVKLMNDLFVRLCQIGSRPFRSDALYVKGKALFDQGDVEESRITFLEAQREAEQIGSRRMLWQILYAQSQLELRQGNRSGAESLLAQARYIVGYIVEHLQQAELSESFLRLPTVHRIMEAAQSP